MNYCRIANWSLTAALWLLPLIALAKAESSRFITTPQSQTVVEGDAVVFTCRATSLDGLRYTWLHNNAPVKNSTRVRQLESNLRIEAVQRDTDAGDYVCIATSMTSGARQASPPARLNIIWIRTASVQLLSGNRNEVTLKCHVEGSSGDGMLEIEWFRNSEKLSTLKNIELQQNRLIIRQPHAADNGLYRCIASNAAGRAMSKRGYVLQWSNAANGLPERAIVGGSDGGRSSSAAFTTSSCLPRLKKNQKLPIEALNQVFLCRGKRGGQTGEDKLPAVIDVTITKGPASKRVKENEPLELLCAHSVPEKYHQVQLRWRKDGKVFRTVEIGDTAAASTSTPTESGKELTMREDSRLVLSRSNGSLLFTNVFASDAGQYVCQIYVEGHRPITSEPAELQVIEQLKFMPQPTSKNLELGSVGKVHCKAQGTPPPQVKWIRDSYGQLPEAVDDINGTLIFKNVSTEHRGNYTCVANNSQGHINATVSVNVVVAPRFSVAPEGPIETGEMGLAVMHCQAIGDPKPTIKWDKDLKYLSENNTDKNRFRFLENGTLEIRDVQPDDEGRYGCTIGNSAGLKREEVRFVVKSSEGATSEESGDGFLITRAVLITMSVAFAYIILVVGLMIWCRFRRQARKARLNEMNKDNPESGELGKLPENEPCLPEHASSAKTRKVNGNNNPRGSGNEAAKSDDTACSNHSKGSKRSHALDQLALPRSSITELLQIGRGEFGDVFVGKVKASVIRQVDEKDMETERHNGGENNGAITSIEKRRSKTSMDDIEEIREEQEAGSADGDTTSTTTDEYKLVLVKALNKFKDENICHEFKRQIDMFRAISHKGVVRLFGLCREKDPHYMVLEYTDWGDLKQFLLATAGKVNTSNNSSQSPPPLVTGQILAVAYQIARGMDAIYRARFIHKDLATRNCVISSDFIVKVSYPALSKDKYSREYYKHRNTLLPVRWLAPECIQEDDYTTKSDIFAFAVIVWELFSQATKLPFEELSNEEVIQRSQNGKLEWACANGTPDSLKEILLACWNSNPKERPSFSQLCSALSKAMQNGDK
ncbi:tyrosine-protein kinase-like otk isoform X2 [Rhagoletis pomonella]|uniref:tyrosine-protein kinase-like otk isoform X2 n=1 Tax=Rhagoletis pomonella TaxID=28610 RepID=UPI001786E76A|nr:tyrosine-protein kinase-like otk isoform X2 [Rhagoletis pomonella]